MKSAEAKAQFLFEAIEPSSRLEYVEDQSSSVHDFWVLQDAARVGAVECTSAHNSAITATYAAILDTRKGGSSVSGRLVSNGWYIHPAPSANVNHIRQHVDRYLAAIEGEGLEAFDAHFNYVDSPAVTAIVNELKVDSGRTFNWNTPRHIGLGLPGQGTWVSSDHVLALAQQLANLADNRLKLARAACVRRILLIEIAHSAYDAWAGITKADLPLAAPNLPAEVTELWLVGSIMNEHVVWRWDSTLGWRADLVKQHFDGRGRAV